MSAIRSALDEMAAVANGELTAEELDADVTELLHVIQRGHVLVAEKLRSMTEKGAIGELGYPSATAYLMHRGRLSPGRARRMVADAQAARSAPAASRAWADGRLSTDQARRVFAVAEAVPDVFPDAEERLVGIVEPLSVTETGKALEYWR